MSRLDDLLLAAESGALRADASRDELREMVGLVRECMARAEKRRRECADAVGAYYSMCARHAEDNCERGVVVDRLFKAATRCFRIARGEPAFMVRS